jgi:hypothetical protein
VQLGKRALRDSGYVLVEDEDSYHGDTRMHSINPGAAQHADFHTHGVNHDEHPTTRRCRTRNPIKLTGHMFRERARRVRRRPFTFVAGLLFWLVLLFSLTFVFEGMCVGEYPISSTLFAPLPCHSPRLRPVPCCSHRCVLYSRFPPGATVAVVDVLGRRAVPRLPHVTARQHVVFHRRPFPRRQSRVFLFVYSLLRHTITQERCVRG